MSGGATFEDVDQSESTHSVRITPRIVISGSLLIGLLVLFGYELLRLDVTDPLVFGWVVGQLDWLWALSWVVLLYMSWPVLVRPERARRYAARLRRNRLASTASLYLLVFGLVGTLGPLLLARPEASFVYGDLPPVGIGVDQRVAHGCAEHGRIVGDSCYGTLAHPFGTTQGGKDVLALVVYGSRLVTEIAMITIALLVPLAAALGSLAAVLGGWIDRVVTGVTDLQRTLPALFVFLLYRFVTGDAGVFHLVVIFGLAHAGSVASVVRSRALDEIKRPYIRAARSAGASRWIVLRDHVIPNVAHVALTAAILQIPTLVVIEATLSYLRVRGAPIMLTPPTLVSWGRLIGRSIQGLSATWWTVIFPVVALVVTILALNLAGEGLRKALGPEGR